MHLVFLTINNWEGGGGEVVKFINLIKNEAAFTFLNPPIRQRTVSLDIMYDFTLRQKPLHLKIHYSKVS